MSGSQEIKNGGLSVEEQAREAQVQAVLDFVDGRISNEERQRIERVTQPILRREQLLRRRQRRRDRQG